MPTLTVYRARKRLFEVPLDGARELLIGRDPQCQIALEGDAVSRHHARIRRHDASRFIVEDISQNGVFINGKKIERAGLKHGYNIEIAQYVLTYRERPGQGEQQPGVEGVEGFDLGPVTRQPFEAIKAPAPAKPVQKPTAFLSAVDAQRLVDGVALRRAAHLGWVVDGVREELILGDEHYIGWDDDCDVRLPGDKWFARTAAYVWRRPGGDFEIRAESFWRKLTLRGRRIKQHVLADGDVIKIGETSIHFFAEVS